MKKNILLTLLIVLIFSTSSAKSKGVYCFFQIEKSIYEDSLIKASIVFRGSIVDLEVYNKTNKVLFIDKGSSFTYKNNTPVCLFQNTSHTIGKTTGGGASVNIGSITGVLGIGGAVGAIANGVNVGGGKSNQSSTTTYEQRILAIAPQASYEVYRWELSKKDITYFLDNKQNEGQTFTFEKVHSPCLLKALITFSTTESFQEIKQLSVDAYVCAMVIDSNKGLYGYDLSKTNYCNRFCMYPFFAYKL